MAVPWRGLRTLRRAYSHHRQEHTRLIKLRLELGKLRGMLPAKHSPEVTKERDDHGLVGVPRLARATVGIEDGEVGERVTCLGARRRGDGRRGGSARRRDPGATRARPARRAGRERRDTSGAAH